MIYNNTYNLTSVRLPGKNFRKTGPPYASELKLDCQFLSDRLKPLKERVRSSGNQNR